MKNLVVHIIAKWMLQTYRLKSDQDVEVSLLTMEPFQLSISIPSWPEMADLMETSLKLGDESETAKVTEILRTKISALQSGQVASKYTAVLSKFGPLITPNPKVEKISFTGGLHWETILMTAGKYFQDNEGVADLTSACKVFSPDLPYRFYNSLYYLELASIGQDFSIKAVLCCMLGALVALERS